MTALGATWRATRLALHVFLGMLLTPLVLSRGPEGRRRTHPKVTTWWHNRAADILGVGITVSGYRPQSPALIVSNHISWLDIVVLGGLTHTVFLSKHEVRRWPVIGWLAAMSGTLFIQRGTGQAGTISNQIARRLRAGGLLTIFPEGTTTDGREVRPFFSRLFAAAQDSDSAVIPVALRYHVDGAFDPLAPYTGNQSIAANLRRLLRRRKTAVHVVFGKPIELRDHTRREIADQARAVICAALASPDQPPLTRRAAVPRSG